MECIVGREALIFQLETLSTPVATLTASTFPFYLGAREVGGLSGGVVDKGYLCISEGECEVDREKLLEVLRTIGGDGLVTLRVGDEYLAVYRMSRTSWVDIPLHRLLTLKEAAEKVLEPLREYAVLADFVLIRRENIYALRAALAREKA